MCGAFDCSCLSIIPRSSLIFFFATPPTTEIYTLSLHDALPISRDCLCRRQSRRYPKQCSKGPEHCFGYRDRKSTRLNSSHITISYAVFCLKKKTKKSPTAQT